MSAAEHADEHDEPLHQAPWVMFVTYGTCFGFLALLMFAKGNFAATAAIIWGTLASVPTFMFLAKREWLYFLASAGAFAGGIVGIPLLL